MDTRCDPSNLFLESFKYNILKKNQEQKSKSQPGETIAERVKLRRQKADDEDLSDKPPLEDVDNLSDMPPL